MDHPSTLLNGDSSGTMTINCEDYGWDRLDGDLLPKKCLNVIPGSLSKTCSCQTGCKTSRCGCRGNAYSCSSHCSCSSCENDKTQIYFNLLINYYNMPPDNKINFNCLQNMNCNVCPFRCMWNLYLIIYSYKCNANYIICIYVLSTFKYYIP